MARSRSRRYPGAMSGSWKICATAGRDVVEAALAAQEDFADWNPALVLTASEATCEAGSDVWTLEVFVAHKPTRADLRAVASLFAAGAPRLSVEHLPEADWVAQSQSGLEPIRAGRFHVHTPDHPAMDAPGTVDFTIPAAQAFGTGQHETTAGCLAMLDAMRRRGVVVRNCADIGTGTGLLAFAALALWPHARATASDIDPVCAAVLAENAALNGVALGGREGQLVMTIGDGMANPLIAARGPFDLVMANILAGPLVDLAPDFADALAPGGHLLLAGLLTGQEQQVRKACMRAGLRLATRLVKGEWSILWLRRRAARYSGMISY